MNPAYLAITCLLAALVGVHAGALWPALAVGLRLAPPRLGQEATVNQDSYRRHAIALTWLLVVCMVACAVVGALLVVTRLRVGDEARRLDRTTQDLATYQACVTDWQTTFIEAYSSRSDAQAATQATLDRLVRAVRSSDDAALGRAIDDYLEQRGRQTDTRRANPLPPVPTVVCGAAPKER